MADSNWIKVNGPTCTFINLEKVECIEARVFGTDVVARLYINGIIVGDIIVGNGDVTTRAAMVEAWIEENLKKV